MKNEGYLFVDHRASPGIPEDWARRAGLDAKLVGEGKMMEAATLTCAHCRTIVIMNPERIRERAQCWKCNAYVCDNCSLAMRQTGYEHRTFEELVEQWLSASLPAKG
jgi:hypothetical protein